MPRDTEDVDGIVDNSRDQKNVLRESGRGKPTMKTLRFIRNSLIALVATIGICQFAAAQSGQILTSPVAVGGTFPYNGGPQTSAVPAHGGTFTCTSSGTITVANTNLTANSIILATLKTAGSPATGMFIATVTPGTGFTITCGSGDTSIYNYLILG